MSLEKTLQQIQKKKFWQDGKILVLLIFSLGLNLFTLVKILIKSKTLSESVVLHFNLLTGIDLVSHWSKLLIYPLAGFLIFILNSILVYRFYLLRKNKLVILLIGALVLFELFCLVAVFLILNFN
jgi:hypothetical protein